eukprot:CAMPEP_0194492046 /NCGR_PEP_ID=MMETSP0253-20130528/10739_1 /TAXON_ID=2966 /ORGANISM="Noctiluca scintillans" /LENGTH=221 /DNA_ID=CAMNT_0039332861 /DNA_START=1 /DNA_END=666 /DNA_ORIENTATION=-
MICAPFYSFVFIWFTLLGSSTSLRVLEVTGNRTSGALENAIVDNTETPDETFNSSVDSTFQVTEPAHDDGAAAQLASMEQPIYESPWTAKSVDEAFLVAELAAWSKKARIACAAWSQKALTASAAWTQRALTASAKWTQKALTASAAWTQSARTVSADASEKWLSKVFGEELILEHGTSSLWALELATGILVLLILSCFCWHRHALRSAEEEMFRRVVHVM